VVMEPRTYLKPESRETVERDELIVDRLAVRLKDLGPATFTFGRQNLWFGNRWLIWDSTPRDGSRSDFFDAARLTLNCQAANTTFDLIGFDNDRDTESRIPPVNPFAELRNLAEQDERGLILYVQNHSLPKTQLDAYFIYRHEENPMSKAPWGITGDTGDFFAFGARAEGEYRDHWQYRTEFAPELGTKNDETLTAFGINSRLCYFVKDRWNHNFRIFHEYLSGDDPNTKTDEGWDPMWGRRAAYSYLMLQTFRAEHNDRLAYFTNLQRVGAGWSFNPTSKAEVLLDYHAMFANTNPFRNDQGFSYDGKFRGHLFVGLLKYAFNNNLTGHLRSEFFLPGDYYSPDRRNLALFLRAELWFTL
jgi:hypothetical protein